LQQLIMPPPKIPSYRQGGLATPAGPAMGALQAGSPQGVGVAGAGPAASQPPMDHRMMEMQINQFAQQHPEQMAQIKQVIMQELQSGNLTPQELNQVVQLATVAAQNPQMYPQIRQFAIQQGIATEQDIPEQYDQGLVVALLIAAKAAQQSLGGAPATPPGAPANAGPMPSYIKGGPTPKGQGKGFVAELHPNEYVVDADTLMYHGKKTFDAMKEKALENKLGITKESKKA
jgi:hypothetical protein